jgi:hypothetical protein
MLDEMKDWFAIWTAGENESNIAKSARYKKTAAGLKVAQSALTMVEGLSALGNNSVAKKERENEYQAIENQVLAAQDQIIESLNYNTDQAITYAARGNVAISSPVLRERFKKGAEEAGRDFAMLEANANVQRVRSDISYARKRRANTQKAISSINQFAFNLGMAGLSFGSGGTAVDPMQAASANNSL